MGKATQLIDAHKVRAELLEVGSSTPLLRRRFSTTSLSGSHLVNGCSASFDIVLHLTLCQRGYWTINFTIISYKNAHAAMIEGLDNRTIHPSSNTKTRHVMDYKLDNVILIFLPLDALVWPKFHNKKSRNLISNPNLSPKAPNPIGCLPRKHDALFCYLCPSAGKYCSLTSL